MFGRLFRNEDHSPYKRKNMTHCQQDMEREWEKERWRERESEREREREREIYRERERVLQRLFHLSLSVAHSSLMLQAFRSLLTVSFHVNFGRPLGRFPSIFISTTALRFSVSSLLLTWPNHSSLLLLITVAIGSTFASTNIYTFLLCSNRLTPIAHRTIIISVVAMRFSSLTDICHDSHP